MEILIAKLNLFKRLGTASKELGTMRTFMQTPVE